MKLMQKLFLFFAYHLKACRLLLEMYTEVVRKGVCFVDNEVKENKLATLYTLVVSVALFITGKFVILGAGYSGSISEAYSKTLLTIFLIGFATFLYWFIKISKDNERGR